MIPSPFRNLHLPIAFAFALFSLLMLTATNYGIFTDELYYVSCAGHLDFGYVDHPPLVAWVTRLSMFFGTSLFVLRILPALAGSATVILAALIARALGGGRFAATFASLTVLCGTVFWVMFGFVSMNAYDILFVTLASYLFILILQKEAAYLWILLGVVVGAGLNTKITMLVFAFGLFAGLVLTPERKLLRRRYACIAAVVALGMYLPHILWQFAHAWPTLEFIRNAHEKNLDVPLGALLGQLVFGTDPFLFPIWVAGIVQLYKRTTAAPVRPLAIAIIVFLGVYLINRSKFYYVLPAIPLLMAAGSVTLERLTESIGKRWIRSAALAPALLFGIATLPFGVPLLPIESFVSYAQLWHLGERVQMEHHEARSVPGYFGQRIGWPEFAKTVASVYYALPDSDRAECGILGFHYGESAGIDYFGPALGLPKAIGRHNSYWLWGPGTYTGKVMLVIVSGEGRIEQYFRTATLTATYVFPYVDDSSGKKRIYICRNTIEPLPVLWPKLKVYD